MSGLNKEQIHLLDGLNMNVLYSSKSGKKM